MPKASIVNLSSWMIRIAIANSKTIQLIKLVKTHHQTLLKKLTDYMLVLKITTPIGQYPNIVSRLVNRKRRFVAEVRARLGALGIEVKFIVWFEKLRSDMFDFRGGLNKYIFGYVGVSQYQSLDDFEYSRRIYTTLSHFE